ncbi:MAG TPA: DUF4214 domain-containing protein [Pirellulales bacterium]|jgi:hypothetical protein|nr:DUF4214 domain-containing protein [Pirellulales bacterium]
MNSLLASLLGRSPERLEARLVLSAFTVTNTSGNPTVSGSLPFEVALANAATDAAIVNFAEATGQTFATHQTITLTGTLTLNHSSEPNTPISIVGPAAGVTIAGGGSGSDFPVLTVSSDTQQAAVEGDSPSGPITITNGNLTGANQSGAGIDDFGDLTLENVAITNNSSAGSGGGIEVSGGPNPFTLNPGAGLLASDTTFSGNTAAGAGGGVDMQGSGAVIINSTFSRNTAGTTGGAINNGPLLLSNATNLGMVNDTISGNSATGDGGGIDNNNGGILGILKTIVATNSAGTNSDVDAGGTNGVLAGSSHDLIGNAQGLSGSGITDGSNGDVVGRPALLSPLGNYGGANASGAVSTGSGDLETFALLPGSPAINDALALANLTANAAATDATIQVGTSLPSPLSSPLFLDQQGKVILIGSEQMLVTHVSAGASGGYSLTVTRGVNGTTATAHNSGDPIDLRDERGVFSSSNSVGSFQTLGFVVAAQANTTPQSAAVSTAFASALAATVTANDPNAPVNGGVITYTAATSGASATLSSATATISGGTASVNATANATAGSYTVSASAGFGAVATFSLTNQAAGQHAAHQVYVIAVYHDVLGRAPDPGGLAYWTQQLDSGAPISSIAESVGKSAEYYANFVIKPDYLTLLGRAADAAGVQFWTQRMQAGLTDQQLEGQFAASDEFFNTAGGNVNQVNWIDAVYKLLLGRAADPAGEKYWNGQLTSLLATEGATDARLQVALGIAGSQENNTNLINDDYLHYLGRAADPGGLAYWLQQFTAGATNEDVIAGFTGSAEYYRDKTGVSP